MTKFLSSLVDEGPWPVKQGPQRPNLAPHSETLSDQETQKPDLEFELEKIPPSSAHPLDHSMRPEYKDILKRRVRFVDLPETPKDTTKVMDKYLNKPKEEDETDQGHQPDGLPFEAIRSFCAKVFTTEYERAEFAESLYGLDCLRDLEHTRRRKLR